MKLLIIYITFNILGIYTYYKIAKHRINNMLKIYDTYNYYLK